MFFPRALRVILGILYGGITALAIASIVHVVFQHRAERKRKSWLFKSVHEGEPEEGEGSADAEGER
jgi:hypothetical protein